MRYPGAVGLLSGYEQGGPVGRDSGEQKRRLEAQKETSRVHHGDRQGAF